MNKHILSHEHQARSCFLFALALTSCATTEVKQRTIEAAIRLGLLLLLATWCFKILYPFIVPVIWGVIIAVPEYHFYVALMFLTSLYFGMNIFSGKPTAKYYGSALIALFILVNSSMGEGADFNEKLIMRILLITLAVGYIVTALKVLESFWPDRNIKQEAADA